MRARLVLDLALTLCLGAALGCAARSDCPPTVVAPASSAAAPAPVAEPAAMPTVVLLVRHAEKADDGTPDPPLTERGQQRAACLAAMLHDLAPTHLLTTDYQRTRATLEPLAAATGLQPVVIDAKDAAAWSQALAELPPGSRAVVAGHSNTLPRLVAELGSRLSALDPQGNVPDDDYDRLVHVVVEGPGRAVAYTTTYCADPAP